MTPTSLRVVFSPVAQNLNSSSTHTPLLAMDDTPDFHETAQSGFPRSPSEFDSDPRISFSKLEDKWILETEEGPEYEYINGLKRWVPVVGTKP